MNLPEYSKIIGYTPMGPIIETDLLDNTIDNNDNDSNVMTVNVLNKSEATKDAYALAAQAQKPFDLERYEILRRISRRGAWGVAYYVEDTISKQIIAVKDYDPTPIAKKQLEERKLTLEDVIRKESTQLRAPDRVVPSWIEKDKNGKLLLMMPAFEKDFEDVLTGYNGNIKHLNEGLSLDDITSYGTDIAKAISGFHERYKEAHCDIKPENIFTGRLVPGEYQKYVVENDGLWLSDSGTRTGSSSREFDAIRSNMGFKYTRAPENFRKDARPRMSSDVWSFGSLVYRLFTGKYFLEDELDNAKDPIKYMEGLDGKISKILVNNKLKNVPKPFRKFLKKCLTFDRYGVNSRYESGIEMKKAWDETIANLDPYRHIISQTKKFIFPAIGAGILAMGIIYGSKLKPDEVTMPKSELQGQVYLTEGIPKDHLVFERDTVLNPEKFIDGVGMLPSDNTLRLYTKNMYVAHLMKAHLYVVNAKYRMRNVYTDEQFKLYIHYTSSDERQMVNGPLAVIAKSLEVGISKSKTPSGVIDLEDVFAVARLGEDKVNMARRVSGSFDWKNYSKAIGSDGKPLVPVEEQNFINECLRYVNLEK